MKEDPIHDEFISDLNHILGNIRFGTDYVIDDAIIFADKMIGAVENTIDDKMYEYLRRYLTGIALWIVYTYRKPCLHHIVELIDDPRWDCFSQLLVYIGQDNVFNCHKPNGISEWANDWMETLNSGLHDEVEIYLEKSSQYLHSICRLPRVYLPGMVSEPMMLANYSKKYVKVPHLRLVADSTKLSSER